MSPSADEHHRYVLALEEQNEQMRAMCEAKDVAFKSVTAEAENLRQRLDSACRIADANARELDLARATIRKFRAGANEYYAATQPVGGAPEKPQQPTQFSASARSANAGARLPSVG